MNTETTPILIPRLSRQAQLQSQLRSRQLALFQHLATILRLLIERLPLETLPLSERRAMQRELASLKKAAQAGRQRLKPSRRRS